jgi:hypothetical protein
MLRRIRSALSARNPFVAEKGPERQGRIEGNIGGTLVKGKSSFALSVEGRSGFDTPSVYVALPDGTQRSELLHLRRPADDWSVYGLVDYALTVVSGAIAAGHRQPAGTDW